MSDDGDELWKMGLERFRHSYSYMTVYRFPPVMVTDLPMHDMEELKFAMNLLVRIIRVIISAWHEDLMQDDSRQRFALLELD